MSTASASSARHEIIGAAREGYHEAVAGLLEADDAAASATDAAGHTALSVAAQHGRVEVIRVLLAKAIDRVHAPGEPLPRGQVDPNQSNRTGQTALHFAAASARRDADAALEQIADFLYATRAEVGGAAWMRTGRSVLFRSGLALQNWGGRKERSGVQAWTSNLPCIDPLACGGSMSLSIAQLGRASNTHHRRCPPHSVVSLHERSHASHHASHAATAPASAVRLMLVTCAWVTVCQVARTCLLIVSMTVRRNTAPAQGHGKVVIRVYRHLI